MVLTDLMGKIGGWTGRRRTLLMPSVPFAVVKSGLNGIPEGTSLPNVGVVADGAV